MPIHGKVKGGGGDFVTVPSGSHIAVCDIVADLGMQPGSALYPSPKRQVYVRFEVPEERVQFEREGQKTEGPAVIGMTFTLSMHEKANLRKQLESWRGKKFSDDEAEKFEVDSILGKGCMLNVVEKTVGDKTYANISSIGALPRGVPKPEAEMPPIYYAEDDVSEFDRLPKWLQEKIQKQIVEKIDQRRPDDYRSAMEITDEDIPF